MSWEEVRLLIAAGFFWFFVVVWIGYVGLQLWRRNGPKAGRAALGAPLLFIGLFIIGYTVVECVIGDGNCFVELWVIAIPLVWLGHRNLSRAGWKKSERDSIPMNPASR